jgi:DNA-binding NtrC family response regulator
MAHVLVVETQASVRLALRRFLESRGHTCEAVDCLDAVAFGPDGRRPELVVLDVRARESEGETASEEWLSGLPVLLIVPPDRRADHGLSVTGRCVQVTRPIDFGEVDALLPQLLSEPRPVALAPPDPLPPEGTLLHESAAMAELVARIERVAPHDMPVLVTGESGTGKELVARELHRLSGRSREPFAAVHCGAIPPALLETELFGHERGAFTDAHRSRAGRFEAAGGGTILLDEIGEMPIELQAKLLRVLQERELVRVGGERTIPVRARVAAATHRDLATEANAGRFRLDLYHRLAVVTLHVPPLRSRPGDVRLLASCFLGRIARDYGRFVEGLSADALALLEAHPWPGNVRELENVLRRAVVLDDASVIEYRHLAPLLATSVTRPAEGADWIEPLRAWLRSELDRGRNPQELRAEVERRLKQEIGDSRGERLRENGEEKA